VRCLGLRTRHLCGSAEYRGESFARHLAGTCRAKSFSSLQWCEASLPPFVLPHAPCALMRLRSLPLRFAPIDQSAFDNAAYNLVVDANNGEPLPVRDHEVPLVVRVTDGQRQLALRPVPAGPLRNWNPCAVDLRARFTVVWLTLSPRRRSTVYARALPGVRDLF